MNSTFNVNREVQRGPTCELSIIVPTYNEKENVVELVQRLERQLIGTSWEVIFVDDNSPDGTANEVQTLAQVDPRVRCVRRIGRRGLSTACIEGVLSSSASYIAVMDGDLQHDESILPAMLKELRESDLDIVVGSRYVEGGGCVGWDQSRQFASRLATDLSHLVLNAELKDPMSGFFMIRRHKFEALVPRLSGTGFKILLDLFASSERPLHFREIPFQFRMRQRGESKLDLRVMWDFMILVGEKLLRGLVSAKILSFLAVSAFGLVVHFIVLILMYRLADFSFAVSQATAAIAAITASFGLISVIGSRPKNGLMWCLNWTYYLIGSSAGVIANILIAIYLYDIQTNWALAALGGALIGIVGSYSTALRQLDN